MNNNIESDNNQPTTEMYLNEHALFFVESDSDDTVLVALNSYFNENSETITWWDSTKERAKAAKNLTLTDGKLSFTDESGNNYTLTPMTMEIYEDKVKDKIKTGDKDVKNMEELIAGFEKSII